MINSDWLLVGISPVKRGVSVNGAYIFYVRMGRVGLRDDGIIKVYFLRILWFHRELFMFCWEEKGRGFLFFPLLN